VFDVVVVAPGSWWSNEMTSRSAVGGGVDVMVGAVRRTRVAAGVSLLDAMKSFCCSRRDCSSLFLLILGWVLIVGGLWWGLCPDCGLVGGYFFVVLFWVGGSVFPTEKNKNIQH
jgi:hypothetical protein